ncbi:ABC transporter substrate-binding protein [Massilia scottii]|uniref:ABC transporter substrate-binding protein n=1 Tax=Massilia scottii TaxID=3057166 RepID=UPI002796B6BF|nr:MULTISPECIES: ABC transporter substrate-binding protein [unclassified Massilia]MDQ1814510.1 ABC transporter substrate-binding protein [Massilia sp. CCM 9210]MDQ1833098.1 ABC transporter substrate-binding protein [Massilia sp. CCM 9029]
MKLSHIAFAAVTLCLGSATFAAETIKIGAMLPLTGGSAPLGLAVRDGQRLAVAQINARGGVMGRNLELVEVNDESKPENAAANMKALLSKGVVACSCGVNTGVVLAYQPVMQAAKLPNVVPASAGTKLTKAFANAPEGNFTFRVQASDTLQAQMMVDYAIKKGYKKIALLHDTTPYGTGGHDDMVKQLLTHDVKAVAVGSFKLGDTDMSAQLAKAREAGAQVLLLYGIGTEQGHVAATGAKLGMPLPIIGSWTNATESFLNVAGAHAEGAISPQTFVEGAHSAAGREFEAAYRAAYKRPRMNNPTAVAGGHDSILLLAAAIRQANSTDGTKIKAALERLSLPVPGAIATYNKPFSEDDHEGINLSSALMAIWKKGAVVRAPL